MKKLLILVVLLFVCSGCSSMRSIPLSDDNCHFEYTATFGEKGTASECYMVKTNAGIQMYCGDDSNIVEVEKITEVCE